ncbi:MAG: hypothetical protein II956_03705 [Bacteroidales bacterium]|nr:hypothetical protein [Bacteroidales bacterium]
MRIVWSKKFQHRLKTYFEYCLQNYGKALTQRKRNEYDKIMHRISAFSESGFIEPLLRDARKEYRAIIFDKKYKIIYTISEFEITIQNLWDMHRNPETLKNDI